MSELQFAKQFLVQASSKPIRYNSDYAEDLRKLQIRGPYTLPKFPKALSKPPKVEERTVEVAFKTLRPPHIHLSLPATPVKTPILALKLTLSDKTGIPIDKLKLLMKGKVLSDVTVVKELLSDVEEGKQLVITIMLMGGAVLSDAGSSTTAIGTGVRDTTAAAQQGLDANVGEGDKMDVDFNTTVSAEVASKREIALDAEFWAELGNFLNNRLDNKEEAEEVLGTFKDAWRDKLQ